MALLEIRDSKGNRRKTTLGEGKTVIGRSEEAALRLEDNKASQLHAMIISGEEGTRIFDLNSTNGVLVNGRKVDTATLNHKDRIRLGDTVITFLSEAAAAQAVSKTQAAAASHLLPRWIRDMPYWAVSALLHFTLLFLVGTCVLVRQSSSGQKYEMVVRREYKTTPYRPELKRAAERRLVSVPKKKKAKLLKRIKPQKITHDIPKGLSLENLSNKNLEHHGAVDVFGMGSGAAGAYGLRRGKGTLVSEGGGEATESAVLAALWWLERHQNPDGSWSSHDFTERCGKPPGEKGEICRNLNPKHGTGRGKKHHDVAATALALLAFTGSGYTHQSGVRPEFVEAARKAMEYLKEQQVTDSNDPECGRLGPKKDHSWIYDQALATMALGELLVLSGDTLGLMRTVERAADFCLKARNKGSAWRYGVKTGENDTSVTGWMVLALKTCKAAPLTWPSQARYREAFQGALKWIDRCTDEKDGSTGYRSADENRPQSTYCMTSVGVLCRLFAGQSRTRSIIRKGVDYILKRLPRWEDKKQGGAELINLYYWYYGSYALFQYGREPWRQWNVAMKRALLESQRKGGCEDGSWDPIGQWGDSGGRVYSTALGAMTLEVYYRFKRASGEGF